MVEMVRWIFQGIGNPQEIPKKHKFVVASSPVSLRGRRRQKEPGDEIEAKFVDGTHVLLDECLASAVAKETTTTTKNKACVWSERFQNFTRINYSVEPLATVCSLQTVTFML